MIYNPRNAFYISRIDGKCNIDVIVQRDTLIDANTLLWLGRKNYTPEMLDTIESIKQKQKEYYMQEEA